MKQYTFVIGTPNDIVNRTISITVVADGEYTARQRAAHTGYGHFGGGFNNWVRLVNRTPPIVGKELETIEVR